MRWTSTAPALPRNRVCATIKWFYVRARLINNIMIRPWDTTPMFVERERQITPDPRPADLAINTDNPQTRIDVVARGESLHTMSLTDN